MARATPLGVALVVVLLASSVPQANTQTTISAGTRYTGNTEWTLAGSPYVVGGLLTIDVTASLTIRQGVQVCQRLSTVPCTPARLWL